jgi:O-acetyl-ADP-ribose deacetylase (regulator of RNase III)
MIHTLTGEIFDSPAEALVNPVNCVGVSGKGLAKDFKLRYPNNFKRYQVFCKYKTIQIGHLTRTYEKGKVIINFPTKEHWRDPSRLEFIEKGLSSLYAELITGDTESIAIPALGCGLGQLKWKDVKLTILSKLGGMDCDIYLYEPHE